MTSLRKRVHELEAEIEALKNSTKQALDHSYKDVERLETENRRLRNELFAAQEQLAFKNKARRLSVSSATATSTAASSALPKEFSMTKDSDAMSSLRDETTSERESSYLSSWSASAMSAIGLKHHQPTHTEKDLLRQLEVLQEEKMRTVQELESKLQRREESIASLEKSLEMKEDAFNSLRSEMEEMKDSLNVMESTIEQQRRAADDIQTKKDDEEVARYTGNPDDSDVDSTLAHRGDLALESGSRRRRPSSRSTNKTIPSDYLPSRSSSSRRLQRETLRSSSRNGPEPTKRPPRSISDSIRQRNVVAEPTSSVARAVSDSIRTTPLPSRRSRGFVSPPRSPNDSRRSNRLAASDSVRTTTTSSSSSSRRKESSSRRPSSRNSHYDSVSSGRTSRNSQQRSRKIRERKL